MFRKRLAQLCDQPRDGKDFSNRDRMNPYDPRSLKRSKSCGDVAHSLGQSAPVFAVPQNLKEPIGQADYQRHSQREAVKEIDQSESF